MNGKLAKHEEGQGHLPSFFDRFFNNDFRNFLADRNMPAVNVKENRHNYKIEVSAPGFDKGDFDVKVSRNVLVITASDEKRREEKGEDEKVIRREFTSSSFARSFTLPDNADATMIEAKEKNGILTVKIPKVENFDEEPPKRIEIK